MSDQAGGGADVGGGRHTGSPDSGMSTVTNVSGFLAGFGLAAVVVIAEAPEHFLWPGLAVLALTIASVVLIVVAQASRRGAYYWDKYPNNKAESQRYRDTWRPWIWTLYHVGIVSLLAGLAAALAPRDGVGGQQALRWVAVCVAFAAAGGEMILVVKTVVNRGEELALLLPGYARRVRRRHGE